MPSLRRDPAPQVGGQSGNALRKADDDQRQNGAEHEAPILGQRLQLVLQQRERERADDRPEEIREAAEHRHEHELARLRPIDQLGIGEPDAEAEDRAADGAEGSRDDEGGQAEPVHVHAEILRLARVVADGLEVQSERRMHDPPHHEASDDQERRGNSSRTARPGTRSCCSARIPARGCSCAARACRCRRRSGGRT